MQGQPAQQSLQLSPLDNGHGVYCNALVRPAGPRLWSVEVRLYAGETDTEGYPAMRGTICKDRKGFSVQAFARFVSGNVAKIAEVDLESLIDAVSEVRYQAFDLLDGVMNLNKWAAKRRAELERIAEEAHEAAWLEELRQNDAAERWLETQDWGTWRAR